MLEKIQQTTNFIQQNFPFNPEFGIILGTGLGGLVNDIEIQHEISYDDIPNFPISTVESHHGKLILGKLSGKNVIAMQGRFHFYEGYSMDEIVFPVRVMKYLGITKLFVSNACGGLNPDFEKGDLMILQDHINLFPGNPLIGKNNNELGPRFPDMFEAYDKTMISEATKIALNKNINVHRGVYVGLTGPMLETPAEYKFLRIIGADVVGMSTVPEIIAAVHLGLKCFAVSIITDLCSEGNIEPINIDDIIATAMSAEPQLTTLIKDLIALQ